MANSPNSSPNSSDKDHFLFPRSSYRGQFTPENLAFNANLQEFAQRIGYICNLETGGKISSMDAYYQIKLLWKELKASKKNLLDASDSGDNPPEA